MLRGRKPPVQPGVPRRAPARRGRASWIEAAQHTGELAEHSDQELG